MKDRNCRTRQWDKTITLRCTSIGTGLGGSRHYIVTAYKEMTGTVEGTATVEGTGILKRQES